MARLPICNELDKGCQAAGFFESPLDGIFASLAERGSAFRAGVARRVVAAVEADVWFAVVGELMIAKGVGFLSAHCSPFFLENPRPGYEPRYTLSSMNIFR